MKHKATKLWPVEIERKGPIAILTVHHETTKGYIDATGDSQLCRAIEEIAFDDSVRVALLRSGRPPFCLGIAVGESEPWRLRSIEALAQVSCPVIAVVDGAAVAEGLELALACDLRFASERTHFALPQIALGRFPRNGATQRLPRLVGRMRALDMLWTGRRVSAREALRWGLINGIYPRRTLSRQAKHYAHLLTQRAPIALGYAKEAVLQGLDTTLNQGMRLEEDLYVLLQTTTDWRSGVEAFRQKTVARFRGR